ncbi:glycosyltransferase [Flavobacteriaceae bacterium XHP0103]|uniref:glycosyltransferase family 2 protein n=1 Tax=Marixanthotalea marina TaxID=2844359 RepID=UPI002989AAB5|nr:glycosyltransferase [Marixanthotalea marina]MBU3822736.1 glycosyltransferase [Marixanthotalea marina]
MEVSILIVSKNRKQELEKTLRYLKPMLDFSKHELLVFLDGCTDGSDRLMEQMDWVIWFSVNEGIGASPARNRLYPKAQGTYLIGLDDDAHPLTMNFIDEVEAVFENNPNVGIVTFEEVKGVFSSYEAALKSASSGLISYLTNDFIGCGFAIKRSVYEATDGFPVWMAIYGEESCVALEVLSKGYNILYTNAIKVNHRVDKGHRKQFGKNYFRFEQQLKNATSYYLVYYKKPLLKILKLYWHNFKKYAMTDWVCFKLFFKVIIAVVLDLRYILKYRKPINNAVIVKSRKLSPIKY